MGDGHGVESIKHELKKTLVDYIETEYFGKTPALRQRCDNELRHGKLLFQDPYYEATPLYETVDGGLAGADIPESVKSFLFSMCKAGRGVFKNPYTHQVDSLESFWRGRDALVSTGTGSGKTECFMWPIVTKLADEAERSPKTWEHRAVRVLILYPMNALVSDQLGRLRRILGGTHDEFAPVWNDGAIRGRRPQFGMYTGRTPYPGSKQQDRRDNEYANTISRDLIEIDSRDVESLKEHGKYPAKNNLNDFVSKIRHHENGWSPDDAEMLVRFEMQEHVPDILVTNYSMLQYMLIRSVERNIWSETAWWLEDNPQEKLLVIIDEAHMYKGAAGGEVALLLRRLMHKLGVGSDRVQFILTSASIPDDNTSTRAFYEDMTGKCSDKLDIIRGKTVELSVAETAEVSTSSLLEVDLGALLAGGISFVDQVEVFASASGLKHQMLETEEDARRWLGQALPKLSAFCRLGNCVRDGCVTLEELASVVFPGDSEAISATDILLNLAALGKDAKGNALLPIRMHMFTRGIQRLTACSNPSCSESKNDGLKLGGVQINKPSGRCACGSKTYELLTDRNCGALFLKGYVSDLEGDFYFWNENPNPLQKLQELVLYVLSEGESAEGLDTGWLDSLTGKVYRDDTHEKDTAFLHVAFCGDDEEDAGIHHPAKCPKCNARVALSGFTTRGNEPFYNVIARQFELQQGSNDPDELRNNPNAGKKVILFSDSRQGAARIAKDLTDSSDKDLIRKVLVLAAFELQEWAEDTGGRATLKRLYPALLKVLHDKQVSLFAGEARKKIEEAIADQEGDFDDFEFDVEDAGTPPEEYTAHLLSCLCDRYRSLSDSTLGWLRPTNKAWKDANKILQHAGVNMTRDEFEAVFYAWSSYALVRLAALDPDASYSARRKVVFSGAQYGLQSGELFKGQKVGRGSLVNVLKSRYSDDGLTAIAEALAKFLQRSSSGSGNYQFISTSKVYLHIDPYADWKICPRCGRVAPYSLWGTCPHCKQGETVSMEGDFEGVAFLK